MGELDIRGKDVFDGDYYMADLVNGYIGKEVVEQEELSNEDKHKLQITTGPNGTEVAIERFRDASSRWQRTGEDGRVIATCVFASELQGNVHLAMPVRGFTYDALDLSAAVDALAESHRRAEKAEKKKQEQKKEAAGDAGTASEEAPGAAAETRDETNSEDDAGRDSEATEAAAETKAGDDTETDSEEAPEDAPVTRKITAAEFLSGLREGDRIAPVLTIVVYLSPDRWTGPRTLAEMYCEAPPEILKLCPQYTLNLLEPAAMSDEEIRRRFKTDLRELFLMVKHADDTEAIRKLMDPATPGSERFQRMNEKVVRLAELVTGIPIPKEEEGKEIVNMRGAALGLLAEGEAKGKAEGEAKGIIETARRFKATDEQIVATLMEQMDVSEDKATRMIRDYDARMAAAS